MKAGWRPQEAPRPKRPDRGGAAVTLCDAPNDRGGAWGEDGNIAGGSPKAAKTSDNGLIGNVSEEECDGRLRFVRPENRVLPKRHRG